MDFQTEWLKRASIFFPDEYATSFWGRKRTFRQMNERVNRLFHALAALGVEKGDRVAFLESNSDHFIEIRYALQKGGIVELPLDARLAADEVKYRLTDGDAETLLFGERFSELVHSLRPQLPGIRNYIGIDRGSQWALDYEKLLEDSSGQEPPVVVEGDDLQCIRYTSGTTGRPKGVMRTYRNSMAIAMYLLLEAGMKRCDRILHVLPLTHMTFLYTGPAFKMGAHQVILDRADAETVLGTIEKEKITLVNLVPTLIYTLTNYPHVKDYNLESLRAIHYAGSSIPCKTLKEALAVFGPIFTQYYGLTECAGYCTALRPEEHEISPGGEARLSSCGRPNSVMVRIVDPADRDVATGEIGEILLKGASVTPGFWKNPNLTEERLANGWLHTGDMAKADGNGFVYIVDRKDDMIITGGFNVYPREVEDVLANHPKIAEVSVVGVNDEKWGEAVKAFVVAKSGASVTEGEIIQFCGKNLASYKKPKSVTFLEKLPKNATGKVLRRDLKRL